MEDVRPLLLRLALLDFPMPPPILFFSATHLLVFSMVRERK
jgi:hypothetical protein